MFLGRVKGHVVSTAKDPSVLGCRLLIVEPLKVDYDDPSTAGQASSKKAATGDSGKVDGGGHFEVTGRAIVAMDNLGAGESQLVLIVQGSSARMAQGMEKIPTDAVIIGIVDEAVVMGKRIE